MNDNLPIFDQTQYTFSVLENAANGTKLGAVKVSNFSLVQRKIWSLCLFFINTNKIFLLFIDPKIRKTFAVLFKARWFTSISKVAIQSQKINFFLMIVRGRNKDCLYWSSLCQSPLQRNNWIEKMYLFAKICENDFIVNRHFNFQRYSPSRERVLNGKNNCRLYFEICLAAFMLCLKNACSIPRYTERVRFDGCIFV